MNEQVARDVVLVRAIETMDRKREILSDDDRMYASRSAKELAEWQASDSKAAVTADHFLQQRAEQILKRLVERTPALRAFLHRRVGWRTLSIGVPLIALLVGAGVDRISDPHRVDLLSAPLLAIIGWNLLVYLLLIAGLFVPGPKTGWAGAGLIRRLSTGASALPRKLPSTLTAALVDFSAEWTRLSGGLTHARLARTMHLAAALFAVGAVLSLLARGLLTQYVPGWESTFLDAAQVHAMLSVLFSPAVWLFHLPGFSVADIDALRFATSPSAAGGKRWVLLYAATMVLLVVAPRLLLAAAAHWRARRLAASFPLDLEQPYFRQLRGKMGGEAGVLRVLPYSFTLDETRDKGLAAVAAMLLGEQARVMLRPPCAYGDEPRDALGESRLDDPAVSLTAVLFNLAATPEKENHGTFIEHLTRAAPRGVAVLVDESSLVERLGAGARNRIDERIALWQQFCRHHGAAAVIVNLLDPQARPLDQGAA
ncbi:MAG: DUF2868 domain-containing protein [Pseudomonadota bacterium]|nr:DUF2868 domain-containing protein [Pseudomonadota bacterium]